MTDNVRSAGLFDRFASFSGRQVERPWFFVICGLFVALWTIGLPFMGWNSDIWHLWLNSPTTSITFLLVALLQNTQARSTKALQHKLDALTVAIAHILEDTGGDDQVTSECVRSLRAMAGVEMEPSE